MGEKTTIHCIAIGGTGVAPLACLLKREGYQVRGSDGPLYPPMSTLLEREGIEPLVGFEAGHLDPEPDLVIVGNAVPRQNPEAVETERRGLERISMPQALWRFFLHDRKPLVVTGTHGKTTTTAIAAFVYQRCGLDPGYLVGGLPLDFETSFERGRGERFILEGDEYNAAYFDRGPKFLHYRPQTLIVTGVEHDHVDLYPDAESFREAFRKLIAAMPADGLLIADGDTAEVRALASEAPCDVVLYGFSSFNDLRPTEVRADERGTRFTVADRSGRPTEVTLQVPGEHNLRNALAVWAASQADGIDPQRVAEALGAFRGVARRLQVVGESGGVTIVDDFAHHPSEIDAGLKALRERYGARRLIAVFEPRSLTAGRRAFRKAYLEVLPTADRVFIAPIFHAGRLSDEERLDLPELAETLRNCGTSVDLPADTDELLTRLIAEQRPGDVIVTMSSGSFDGLPHRLAAAIDAARGSAPPDDD